MEGNCCTLPTGGLFVRMFIFYGQNNKISGCVVIYVGESFSALQTCAALISLYRTEVVLQAGCGKLDSNSYFPSSSARRLRLPPALIRWESHLRLVDLSWPVHQQWRQSAVRGWTWEIWLVWARQYLTLASLCEPVGRECDPLWMQMKRMNVISYLEHRVTALGSHFFSMQLTPELCCNIALVFW